MVEEAWLGIVCKMRADAPSDFCVGLDCMFVGPTGLSILPWMSTCGPGFRSHPLPHRNLESREMLQNPSQLMTSMDWSMDGLERGGDNC